LFHKIEECIIAVPYPFRLPPHKNGRSPFCRLCVNFTVVVHYQWVVRGTCILFSSPQCSIEVAARGARRRRRRSGGGVVSLGAAVQVEFENPNFETGFSF
jgi:hypothetical protein